MESTKHTPTIVETAVAILVLLCMIRGGKQVLSAAHTPIPSPPLAPPLKRLQVVRLLPGWIAERVVKPANFGQCFVALRKFFAEMHTS